MPPRNRRNRHFQFDALERRETPSSLGGGTMQALATKAISFKGSANGAFSSEDAATFHGSATHLGAYTGTLTAVGANTGDIVLVTSTGALDLTSTGKYGKVSRAGIEHGTFHFTITGGTDAYAGATGSGTITATVNHNTGALSSTISGKVKP